MKNSYFFILNIFVLIFFSCQKEENTFSNDSSKSITATSPLAKLISRVCQNPTSVDNILDNSSCFSVVLPVSITVNGITINVTSQDDFAAVKNAKDNYANDDDVVHFTYPIIIKHQNFTTEVVSNENQLNEIIDNCSDNDDDDFDEINCIAFNFPFVINVYDSTNQVANSITFQNNLELYNFIEGLENDIYITIKYPISITNSEGEVTEFYSNALLEEYIEDAINECNANSGSVNSDFTSTIVNGNWGIVYFFENNDYTTSFSDYNFIFYANHSVSAIKNSSVTYGEWSLESENGYQKLHLEFNGSELSSIEKEWKITEFNLSTFHLKHTKESSQGNDYLYFEKK